MIKDVDTIELYEEALQLILPKPGEIWARIIGYLRWELVKACPKNEEASKTCFKACLAQQDYEHARHIANGLEKNFPGKHEYVFWNIVTMFLYSVSCPSKLDS
jgi:N-terminal acetyltransferase B complex non-catalytic subunit